MNQRCTQNSCHRDTLSKKDKELCTAIMIETLKEYYNMDEGYATYVAKQIMQGPTEAEVAKGHKVINYTKET